MSNPLRDVLANRKPTEDRPDGAVRVPELAAELGWGEKKVREYIRALLEAGECERVQVYTERLDGVMTRVTAYRLVGE